MSLKRLLISREIGVLFHEAELQADFCGASWGTLGLHRFEIVLHAAFTNE